MSWSLLAAPGARLPAGLVDLPRWRPGDAAVVVAVSPGLREALERGPLAAAWQALAGPHGEVALLPVWAGGTRDDLPDELTGAAVLDADAALPEP